MLRRTWKVVGGAEVSIYAERMLVHPERHTIQGIQEQQRESNTVTDFVSSGNSLNFSAPWFYHVYKGLGLTFLYNGEYK